MNVTPEATIRVLLKRAAKASAEDLPKIIDAITALHRFQAPEPSIDWSALDKRLSALEERSSLTPLPTGIGAGSRFR